MEKTLASLESEKQQSRTAEAAGEKLSAAGQTFSGMGRDMLDRLMTLVDDTKDIVERMVLLLILKVMENIVLAAA